MRVLLVCPAPRGSRSGNRRTAERWARLLRALGHRVRIVGELGTASPDVLVALHAGHSAEAVRLARERMPTLPIVVALTGTDLSHDIHVDDHAMHSLAIADRIVVLHELAPREVPARHRDRVRVIRQSARAPATPVAKARGVFEIAVVSHLRAVKDPLRAAAAVRSLPSTSRALVVHAGAPLDRKLGRAATIEARHNPRYRWLGDVSPARALRLIARAHVFVLSSVSEGGANVLGEAAMCGTPVLASDIPAVRAALGADYPGVFPVGDETALARLIARAETDRAWLTQLRRRVIARRSLFAERRELAAWRELLAELVRSPRRRAATAASAPSARR
jgi:putative glycosyltransferase (TIGR04348 family)